MTVGSMHSKQCFFILLILLQTQKKPPKQTVSPIKNYHSKSVFVSVVTDAFQITFRPKIYTNDVFLFFKNHF